jgi:hypothetical protein
MGRKPHGCIVATNNSRGAATATLAQALVLKQATRFVIDLVSAEITKVNERGTHILKEFAVSVSPSTNVAPGEDRCRRSAARLRMDDCIQGLAPLAMRYRRSAAR